MKRKTRKQMPQKQLRKFFKLKKVIFLYGPQNSGKTTCLNELIKLLSFCCTVSVASVKTWNKHLCFNYPLANSSRIIKLAIKTAGDNAADVESGLKFAEDKECEILVASVRSSPDPIDAALSSFDPRLGIEQMTWVEKYQSADDEDRKMQNCKQAIELCGLIAKLV